MASTAAQRYGARLGTWAAATLLAALTFAALPARGAMAVSVTDTQAASEDASYQKLVDAANAVVGVTVRALPDARSNDTLGLERKGSGVLIGRDGLVLTIGYLITEADQVEITDAQGQQVPAAVVACDYATGFALVRSLVPLTQKPIRLGSSAPVARLDRLMIVTGGEGTAISIASVVSRRQYAGYWEYLIDGAIFTAPPRVDHSGAALINEDGELVGIGSLFVMDALAPGERLPGNMFVPVDLLKPILEEMVRTGAQPASHRPWLGMDSLEEDGRVKVMLVDAESPADQAGIVAGDIILGVEGRQVDSLEQFYRLVWARGPAGVDVRLTVLHGPTPRDIVVRSIDRAQFMQRKPGI